MPFPEFDDDGNLMPAVPVLQDKKKKLALMMLSNGQTQGINPMQANKAQAQNPVQQFFDSMMSTGEMMKLFRGI